MFTLCGHSERHKLNGMVLSFIPAMRPCTWKSGITSRDLSWCVSSYVTAMLCRLAAKLACVSGTPFGFDVVPVPVNTPLIRYLRAYSGQTK